jgi:hypothetical protein
MKRKYLFPCLFFLMVAALIVNSCKKEKIDNVQTLFTGGHWQLASLQVTHFVGDTLKSTDTLFLTCPLVMSFTFNADNTCTYENFDCIAQPLATGHWSLSGNRLFLSSDIAVKDSTGNATPFTNAQIDNVGQYSLVLETGNLETFYPPNMIRTKTRYGFVRQKTQ